MSRSGVSNLFDDLNLELGALPGSSGTMPLANAGSDSASSVAPTSSTAGALSSIPEAEMQNDVLQQKEVMQQKEADRYVQVITASKEPFEIVWASEAWLKLCEYRMPQVIGHTLELIQGPQTTREAVAKLMGAIRSAEAVTLSMTNHTRTGRPFSHTLRVEPLRDSAGNVQCFQATSSSIHEGPDPQSHPGSDSHPGSLGEVSGAAPRPAMSRTSSQQSISDLLAFDDKVSSAGTTDEPSRSASAAPGGISRTNSKLEISEMLDLFDQESGQRSPLPATAQ